MQHVHDEGEAVLGQWPLDVARVLVEKARSATRAKLMPPRISMRAA
jgi:ATP-dependent Clp protease adapter protein ClpS